MKPKNTKLDIAGVDDPTFEAIVGGFFRFATESQALACLQRISKKFQINDAQDPIEPGHCPTLKLWIHGFSVTDEEHEKGFAGQFARLVIQKLETGKVTIIAEKITTPLNKHPVKRTQQRQNPNYGHKLVRAATRAKTFESLEELRHLLLQMHEDFPETTIPGKDKLYFMLYSRSTKPPLKKVRLCIAPVATGGYKLELTDYIKKHNTAESKDTSQPMQDEGKFSSMVRLQRKRKNRIKSKKKKPTTE